MSRLFTHHDRLYLFGSDEHRGMMKRAAEEGDDESTTSTTKKQQKKGGGLSLYIPHFHKVFGLLALINIALYWTPYYEDISVQLGPHKLMLFSLVHPILALSSFEFRIGRARNGLYTIYREMQLHTIVFTMRSWTVMVGEYFGIQNLVLRATYILAWHLVADWVTKHFPTPNGETTIRRSVNGEKGYKHHGQLVHVVIWFFSFSQLVGTFMLIADTANAGRNAMFVMGPVQLSAFLATMVRKGYFRSETSFVLYFLCLQPIFWFHRWAPIEVVVVLCVTLLRFNFRFSKYILWIGVTLVMGMLTGDLVALLPKEGAATTSDYFAQLQVTATHLSAAIPSWMWSRKQLAHVAADMITNETGLGQQLGEVISHVGATLGGSYI